MKASSIIKIEITISFVYVRKFQAVFKFYGVKHFSAHGWQRVSIWEALNNKEHIYLWLCLLLRGRPYTMFSPAFCSQYKVALDHIKADHLVLLMVRLASNPFHKYVLSSVLSADIFVHCHSTADGWGF